MSYEVIPSDYFLKQLAELDSDAKNVIKKKIELIGSNPFRFKSISSNYTNRVFSVRLTSDNVAKRLIYVLRENNIILCCILDRDKGYKELYKLLEKVLGEF